MKVVVVSREHPEGLPIDAGWTRWSNCKAFDDALNGATCGGQKTAAAGLRFSHVRSGASKKGKEVAEEIEGTWDQYNKGGLRMGGNVPSNVFGTEETRATAWGERVPFRRSVSVYQRSWINASLVA